MSHDHSAEMHGRSGGDNSRVVALPADLAAEVGKQQPFTVLEQETALNLLRTHEALSEPFDRLFKQHRVSQPLYNILRILRGTYQMSGADDNLKADACGLAIQRIGSQMLTREPDMTRLIDRLETRGLVKRNRCPHDRRVVLIVITHAGLELLGQLDEPVLELHRAQFAHMAPDRLNQLNELLYEARHADAHARS